MIRSPETSMPPMMTRPKTTNWSAGGKAEHSHHLWFSPARKKAAAQVEIGLARPPVKGGAADHHRGDGPEEVRGPTVTPGGRRSAARSTPAVA